MITFRQKEFDEEMHGGPSKFEEGITDAVRGGARGIQGVGGVLSGVGKIAGEGIKAVGKGVSTAGQIAAAHPIIPGALAAFGIYKLLKRRRRRREEERGYSVIERMYSTGKLKTYAEVEYRKAVRRAGDRKLKDGYEQYATESVVEEKSFARVPKSAWKKFVQKAKIDTLKGTGIHDERVARGMQERISKETGKKLKPVDEFVFKIYDDRLDPKAVREVYERFGVPIRNEGSVLAQAKFSEVSDQLSIPMPVPKEPRQEVPKKIVKKAEKSGVVQRDSEGHWRIINMHGPGGKAIYWKPVYKSKEAAENCLRAYQSGKWNKK